MSQTVELRNLPPAAEREGLGSNDLYEQERSGHRNNPSAQRQLEDAAEVPLPADEQGSLSSNAEARSRSPESRRRIERTQETRDQREREQVVTVQQAEGTRDGENMPVSPTGSGKS